MKKLTSRQRVINAIERKPVDRTPIIWEYISQQEDLPLLIKI